MDQRLPRVGGNVKSYMLAYDFSITANTAINVFPARPDRASRGKLDSLCLSSIAINEGFISFISGDLLVCLPRQINNFLIRFRNVIKPSALKTQNQSENLLVKIFNSKIFRNFCLHNLKRRLLASLMMLFLLCYHF